MNDYGFREHAMHSKKIKAAIKVLDCKEFSNGIRRATHLILGSAKLSWSMTPREILSVGSGISMIPILMNIAINNEYVKTITKSITNDKKHMRALYSTNHRAMVKIDFFFLEW